MSPAFLNLNLNKRHQMKTTLCCLLLKLFITFFNFCGFFFSFFYFLCRVAFLGKKSPCSKNSPFKKRESESEQEKEREKEIEIQSSDECWEKAIPSSKRLQISTLQPVPTEVTLYKFTSPSSYVLQKALRISSLIRKNSTAIF